MFRSFQRELFSPEESFYEKRDEYLNGDLNASNGDIKEKSNRVGVIDDEKKVEIEMKSTEF